jgi:hypothetical protein
MFGAIRSAFGVKLKCLVQIAVRLGSKSNVWSKSQRVWVQAQRFGGNRSAFDIELKCLE